MTRQIEGDMNMTTGGNNVSKQLGQIRLEVGMASGPGAVPKVAIKMIGDNQILPSPCILPLDPLQALNVATGIIQAVQQAIGLQNQQANAMLQQMSNFKVDRQ